jgi:hypothetical protein
MSVYVAMTANTKGIYHTIPECDNAPEHPREWTLADAEKMGYEKCSLCAADGDWSDVWADDHGDDTRRSLRSLLRDGEVDHIEGHPEDQP